MFIQFDPKCKIYDLRLKISSESVILRPVNRKSDHQFWRRFDKIANRTSSEVIGSHHFCGSNKSAVTIRFVFLVEPVFGVSLTFYVLRLQVTSTFIIKALFQKKSKYFDQSTEKIELTGAILPIVLYRKFEPKLSLRIYLSAF